MKQKKLKRSETKAERLYVLLLNLYPRTHRQEYGSLMLQAFKDHYHETREVQGQVGITFWLDVVADETKSLLAKCNHLATFVQETVGQTAARDRVASV